MSFGTSKFADKILNDETITLYDKAGSTSRDYTYIDDIIDGIEACIKNVKGLSYRGWENSIVIKYTVNGNKKKTRCLKSLYITLME